MKALSLLWADGWKHLSGSAATICLPQSCGCPPSLPRLPRSEPAVNKSSRVWKRRSVKSEIGFFLFFYLAYLLQSYFLNSCLSSPYFLPSYHPAIRPSCHPDPFNGFVPVLIQGQSWTSSPFLCDIAASHPSRSAILDPLRLATVCTFSESGII